LIEFGGEQGEKRRWTYEKLKKPVPPEPQLDSVVGEIIEAYRVISRSRNYAGMAASPLPLSLSGIEQYLSSRPLLIDRDEFDAAIFALDDAELQSFAEKQARK